MGSKIFLYIGGGILLLMGLCLLGYGFMLVLGSTSGQGYSGWFGYGLGFGAVGLLLLGGGIGLFVTATRSKVQEGSGDNVTYKIDLPASTKIEEMKCRNCGGNLKADNVKMVLGAPTVECPFCSTTYQLTEEPKW